MLFASIFQWDFFLIGNAVLILNAIFCEGNLPYVVQTLTWTKDGREFSNIGTVSDKGDASMYVISKH